MTSRTHHPWRTALLMLFAVLLAAAAYSSIFFIRAYVIEPFRIPSASMVPSLLVGDFIAAYKWPYGNPGSVGVWLSENQAPSEAGRPARGDIVLFRFPRDPQFVYIQRVIGLPADTVRYQDNGLYINGERAGRKFISSMEMAGRGGGYVLDVYEETINDRTYRIGLTKDGAPSEPFETTVPAGHYFVMGDNRDRSNDSRYWGFVPETHLVGRPVAIWFSFDPQTNSVRTERMGSQPR